MKRPNTIDVIVYNLCLFSPENEYIGYDHDYEVEITSGIDYLTKQEAKEALIEHFKPDLIIEAKDFDPVNFIVPADQPHEEDEEDEEDYTNGKNFWGIKKRHRYTVIAGDFAMVFLKQEKEYNPFKDILCDDVDIHKYYTECRKKCLDEYEDRRLDQLIAEDAAEADDLFIHYCFQQLGDIFESGNDIIDKGYIDRGYSTYPEKAVDKNNVNYIKYCKLTIINNAMQIGEEQNNIDNRWNSKILSEAFVKAYNENRLTERQQEWLTRQVNNYTALYMSKKYYNYKED